ncbi:MAG: histidine kinase dimerization/phospho-acceptor domain-containing protein [Parvularculaceae bacterium]
MLRRYFPKSLYARVTLIVILPIFLTQALVTYVFFARHWDRVTASLSENVAGEIALVSDMFREAETEEARNDVMLKSLNDLHLRVIYDPAGDFPPENLLDRFNVYNATLMRRLDRAIKGPYWLNTKRWKDEVEIRVPYDGGVLIYFARKDRVFATTGRIFLFWLVGTSILLGAVGIVFMRNQVRSILRLATAAEAFGRGRDSPDYRPSGATEVRKAGYAFIAMRERLKRHLEQRTAMLAGISHDLRTPLTRIKLALAMQPDDDDIVDLRKDVLEMERMIAAYLDFARNEAADEEPETFRLSALITEIVDDARRTGREVEAKAPGAIAITARRMALKRAIGNLVTNALRHAEHVRITAFRTDRYVEIHVDDDGPAPSPIAMTTFAVHLASTRRATATKPAARHGADGRARHRARAWRRCDARQVADGRPESDFAAADLIGEVVRAARGGFDSIRHQFAQRLAVAVEEFQCRFGRAAGRCHRLAHVGGAARIGERERAGAGQRGAREFRRGLGRETERDARFRQRFGEEKIISGAGARHRGDKINFLFRAHPHNIAGGAQEALRQRSALLIDRIRRIEPGDALADGRRQVRHGAHDFFRAAEQRGNRRDALARHHRDNERVARQLCTRRQRIARRLRLHRRHHDINGSARRIEREPVLGAERAHRLANLRIEHGGSRRIDRPGGKPAFQQRAAHGARANQRNGRFVGHAPMLPNCDAIERAKPSPPP